MLAVLEVAVHQRDGDEEGLIVTVEVGEYFDDPVDHTGADWSCYLVTLQAITGVEFLLSYPEIVLDVITELSPDVDVLALDISGLLP